MNAKQIIARHRPEEHVGRGDKYLAPMAQGLRRDIARVQRSFPYDTFCLQSPHLNELAARHVEFGEDIHNSIGIWESLETYNQEFFGVPLPCTIPFTEPETRQCFSAARIQHLLWVLWAHFKPSFIALCAIMDIGPSDPPS